MSVSSAPVADNGGETLPIGLQRLKAEILHAAHLLPSQGPIGVFIHHNTLHAFEHLGFDEAVEAGSRIFGCEPYLSEDRYRDELSRGRILFSDLHAVLHRDLGLRGQEVLHGLSTRLELHLAMLEHPLRSGDGRELDWFMAETDAPRRARRDVSEVQRKHIVNETRHWVMRRLRGSLAGVEHPAWIDGLFARFKAKRIEDWPERRWETFSLSALWQVCLEGTALAGDPQPMPGPTVRKRDLLLAATGVDTDLRVNAVLIPLCAAFIDQGIAHWPLPDRDRGLYHAFCSLHEKDHPASPWWLKGLGPEIARLKREGVGALASIAESLDALGIDPVGRNDFLSATLLALRGWGGIVHLVEQRPDRVHHPIPLDSLIDFLAVRLLLERQALKTAAQEFGLPTDLIALRAELIARAPSERPTREKKRAFLIFQLAQVLGWTPEQLFRLDPRAWVSLFAEVEGFSELNRRRVFHLAYEHRFRVQTLEALASRQGAPIGRKGRPSFQAVFCIDEREESIRRHVEETAPTAETFGAAGFFGVAMYYRSAAAADFTPLCPAVMFPGHWVSEAVDKRLEDEARRRSGMRRRLGMALQNFHGGSRRLLQGAFLSTTVGLLATIPLVTRVVFPRLTHQLEGFFGRMVAPPPVTRLVLERRTEEASPQDDGHGYLLSEMIDISERLLRDIGLIDGFSRIVLIFGHGSTSMNNPHESAHDCGACGGGPGGANARAIAQMLNDPRVRAALATRRLAIPADTVFVGGLHNTANDDVHFFDADRVPGGHRAEFELALSVMREAVIRNAHERARRFGTAPLGITPIGAKHHMEGRAQDLSQVRPEWGHATNAICIVGRRARTRGLYLDRRPFLVSYDPTTDSADAAILARILGAAVPVCSGINLEYYFSYVDSPGWGSGSKLPHNITGLIGVMDGAMSDLRTGLPWQMVEIHEPMRLLFVIETTPQALFGIMERNGAIQTLIANRWVQLVLQDPDTGALSVYHDGEFEPFESEVTLPVAASSREWYTGWRDHLQFAEISPSAVLS